MSTLRSLYAHVRSEPGRVGLIVFLTAALALNDLGKAVVFGQLFGASAEIGPLLGILVGLFVAQAVLWVFRSRALAGLIAATSRRARTDILAYVHQLPLGELPALATFQDALGRHVAILEQWILTTAPKLIWAPAAGLGAVVLLFYVDWRLASLTVVLAAGLQPIVSTMRRRYEVGVEAGESSRSRLEHVVTDFVTGQADIRVFGLQRYWTERAGSTIDALAPLERQTHVAASDAAGAGVLGAGLLQTAVIAGGAALASLGVVTFGELMTFFGALMILVNALRVTAECLPLTLTANTSALELAQVRARVAELATPTPPVDPLESAVELRELWLSFGTRTVLKGVSLRLEAGESVAIVGPSGSGKSTVLGVLLGLCNAEKGSLVWDGAETDSQALRPRLGAVFQDAALFDLTVRENIRLGHQAATEEEIFAAAREADIHDTILGLEHGYETVVGPGGSHLSGGQRQRVALARALVRRPSVLVLDEATSALDPRSAAAVLDTLEELAGRIGQIHVTHRLTGLERMDEILVLDAGVVVERGTHDALIEARGLYADMVARQRGIMVEKDGRRAWVTPEALVAIPLFSTLDEEDLAQIASEVVSEHHSVGSGIVLQGNEAHDFFLIAQGTVQIIRDDEVVGRLVEGEFFGEIALLSGGRRNATVRASSPTTLLSLSKESFELILDSSPAARERIAQVAEKRRALPDPV